MSCPRRSRERVNTFPAQIFIVTMSSLHPYDWLARPGRRMASLAPQASVASQRCFKPSLAYSRTCVSRVHHAPLSHPRASSVRPGCRTAGRYGLIRGVPSNWLLCGDSSSRPLSAARPAVVISRLSILSEPSFGSHCDARSPRAPYGRPSSPSDGLPSTGWSTGTLQGQQYPSIDIPSSLFRSACHPGPPSYLRAWPPRLAQGAACGGSLLPERLASEAMVVAQSPSKLSRPRAQANGQRRAFALRGRMLRRVRHEGRCFCRNESSNYFLVCNVSHSCP